MRRALLGAVLLILGVAAVVSYTTVARDRNYARFISEGDQAAATDRLLAAIEAYTGALTLKPDAMLAYLKRGEIYRRQAEWTSALRDLSHAVRLDPTAPRPLERVADVDYALGRFSRAAERYAEYVLLDDRSPRVLYKLAVARHRSGMVGLAIDAARQAIALDEAFPEAHALLGACLAEQEHHDEAAEALERAVALAPTLTSAREQLASVYRESGRSRDEIDQLRALNALEPERAEREVELGLAYARAGQTEQAVLSLGRAAERHPDFPQVYVAAGRVWLDIAQRRQDRVALSKALEALQRPLATEASTSETLTLLGRALLLANDAELAERMLEQATDTWPVEAEAFAYLADAASQLEHYPVARDALLDLRALQGEPDTESERAAFAVRIATLSLAAEEPSVAAEWFRRAIQSDPGNGQLWADLADAELGAGDVARARATLDEARIQYPQHPSLEALAHRIP